MRTFDVVIIGSGAGGSPVAEVLARSGAKVLVVEKGPRLTREDFGDPASGRDEIEWCRRDKLIPNPLHDPHTRRNDEGKRAYPTTDGWISSVVGGGTVHMGAYMLRADPLDAKQGSRTAKEGGTTALDWAVPFADVARRYAEAEAAIGVSGAKGLPQLPALAGHALGERAMATAKALGRPAVQTPRAILTAPRPDEDRLSCAYRPLCASYGCPNDAKGSMAVTFLRRAEKTGNCTVEAETMCVGVDVNASGAVSGVRLRRKGQPEEQVRAGRVVVAGGAIESARLLMLSGPTFAPGGRGNVGGQLGKNLWFSLFVETVGFLEEKTALAQGASVLSGSPFLNVTVMPGGHLPADVAKDTNLDRAGTLQLGFVHDNPIHRAERVATEGGFIWGTKLKQKLRRYFTEGRQIVVEGFGESVPHAGAYVDLDPKVKDFLGQPAARITYFHHPRDMRVARQMAADSLKLLEGLGCTDVSVTRGMGETTVLQGGTCRFGADPKNSVTDPTGQVHGVKGLYVTDGGSLPSSLAVPVTLTIVANALRIAQHVVGA